MKKEFLDKSDWYIEEETFKEHFAKLLNKNPKRIKAFKTQIIKEYNETKDFAAFLENLKIIAIAERKTSALAEKTKMKRSNIYRILSKGSNPSFFNITQLAHSLGFDFYIKSA